MRRCPECGTEGEFRRKGILTDECQACGATVKNETFIEIEEAKERENDEQVS